MRCFQILTVLGSLFLATTGVLLQAQQPPPDQTLTPQQLENLVAPIALYPDPLLSQIMVAATDPLEVAETPYSAGHATSAKPPIISPLTM
jgi:hypothetical protein